MTSTGPLLTSKHNRCASWTRDQEVDPIGSAGTYDAVLLVEAPTPWPNDVSAIPMLADAVERDRHTRVLAVVPRHDDDSGRLRVVQWRRASTARFTGTDHRTSPAGVADLLARLIDHPDRPQPEAVGPAPTDILVCAHGRRDPCCGRFGTLLGIEVAARWDHIRTWRSSHTGGHRFAPTGFTFPDGRAWAFLDAAMLDGIVQRTADLDELLTRYRGSTALDRWGQVVERELFRQHGWGWLDHELTGNRTRVADDGLSAEVNLSWTGPSGSGNVDAQVKVLREMPVPVCGEPPETATKTSPELALTAFQLRP